MTVHATVTRDIAPGTTALAASHHIPFRERLGCTVREACVALGIGRTLLYDLISRGSIATRKLGRRTIVCVPSLLALTEQPQLQPPPRPPQPENV